MNEQVEEICDMIDGLQKEARKMRMVECQNNSAMGFCYYQGVIDVCQDVVDRIYEIDTKPKDTNGKEII